MFPDGMRSGAIIHQFQGVFYGGIFSHAPGEETWHQGRQQTILVQRTEKLFTVTGSNGTYLSYKYRHSRLRGNDRG